MTTATEVCSKCGNEIPIGEPAQIVGDQVWCNQCKRRRFWRARWHWFVIGGLSLAVLVLVVILSRGGYTYQHVKIGPVEYMVRINNATGKAERLDMNIGWMPLEPPKPQPPAKATDTVMRPEDLVKISTSQVEMNRVTGMVTCVLTNNSIYSTSRLLPQVILFPKGSTVLGKDAKQFTGQWQAAQVGPGNSSFAGFQIDGFPPTIDWTNTDFYFFFQAATPIEGYPATPAGAAGIRWEAPASDRVAPRGDSLTADQVFGTNKKPATLPDVIDLAPAPPGQ